MLYSLYSPRSPTSASSSAIADQESLAGIETEMRKLEGLVKEIVDELDYLKKREERSANTNRMPSSSPSSPCSKYINGETCLAVTSHAEGEIGICFKNYLAPRRSPGPLSSW